MNDQVVKRQPEVDIAFINAKTRIAITLALGGMLSLLVGLVVLLYGASTDDAAVVRIAGLEVDASGIGAVIMVTSVMWAYLAYRVRPTYSARHSVSQVQGPDGSYEYRQEMATTQIFANRALGDALEADEADEADESRSDQRT